MRTHNRFFLCCNAKYRGKTRYFGVALSELGYGVALISQGFTLGYSVLALQA
jgi:hypothetical protein